MRRRWRSRSNPDPEIQQPNEAELEWVASNLGLARELVAGHTGASSDPLELPALDESYGAWFDDWSRQPEGERDDPNVFINAYGIAFGQHLVDTLDLRWAIVTDEHGTEIAVHGQPGDVLVFPPNLVAKRFERGETRFFQPVYDGIRSHVEELRG
jgi:hypothetical protein